MSQDVTSRCLIWHEAKHESEETNGGLQVKFVIIVEVKDAAKPALVAECLYHYFA